MRGKRLGEAQDVSARAERDVCLRPAVGSGGEEMVELAQPRDCDRSVSLCEGPKRDVELRSDTKPRSQAAKLDNFGANRQRRHELRLLQRLGLVRQCREPAVDAALPILRAGWQGSDREAAQIAQGE